MLVTRCGGERGRLTAGVLGLVSLLMAPSAGWAAEEPLRASERERQVTPGEAVDGELKDVARALRSLDQSYAFRGMQGCGACTAGSVFVDWKSRGVPAEKRVQVLPPPPLVLSGARRRIAAAPVEEAPRATVEPQPDEAAPPAAQEERAPPPIPCPHCGESAGCGCAGQAAPVVASPVPCPCETRVFAAAPLRYREPTVFPAPVYTRGSGRNALVGCGGYHVPPHVVQLHGRWVEPTYGATTLGADGFGPGMYAAPPFVVPQPQPTPLAAPVLP